MRHKRIENGFTLVELLVVIAIIGVLAAVALPSLGKAKEKARVSAVKAQLKNLQSAAELFAVSSPNSGYSSSASAQTGSCTGVDFDGSMFDTTETNNASKIIDGITSAGGTPECHVSVAEWAVASLLPDGDVWCVDSLGTSQGKDATNTAYTGTLSGGAPALSALGTTCN